MDYDDNLALKCAIWCVAVVVVLFSVGAMLDFWGPR